MSKMSLTLNVNPDFIGHLVNAVDDPEQRVFVSIAAIGLASCPWILDLETLSECTDIPIEVINLILDKWAGIGLISINRDEGDSLFEQSLRLNVLGVLAAEKSSAPDFIAEMNQSTPQIMGSEDVPVV
jgi:hypothetical protein